MPESTLLYYITDRTGFPGDERARRLRLLDKIAEAASAGVHYIQLREKDLCTRDLESLAREAARIIFQLRTALLINSRSDVALAASAAGVHLPAQDVSPADVLAMWKHSTAIRDPLISISCHSPEEVVQAAACGANMALLAPVFEKQNAPGTSPQGLDALRQACRAKIPVLALGGITLQNAKSCLQAGATGIAAIRLFQENDIATIVRTLRAY
ncbi:MAG: thiamine phosphate synthase [Candidatus Sulfotelmatobacter sp.]|jgi:thiamine-phosphate pyrophosphorylase